MNVLWVGPWFSTLAGQWIPPLRSLGHRVLLVTSERHFEPREGGAEEIVVRKGPRSMGGLREGFGLAREVRRFQPDVVVTEQTGDPRLAWLGHRVGVPRLLMVHDARPHDETHGFPWHQEWVRRLQLASCDGLMLFSQAVRVELDRSRKFMAVIPMTSEMRDVLSPTSVVRPDHRRDFVMLGRLAPYKNMSIVFAAWQIHVGSPQYRGDKLRIWGDGSVQVTLPPHCDWRRGRYSFSTLSPVLSQAKGSVAVYRSGSQSGAQVISMQCGTPVIASSVGGISEYMPDPERAADPNDVEAVANRFGQLADPMTSFEEGCRAREFYNLRLAPEMGARDIDRALRQITSSRGNKPRVREPGQ